MNLAEIFAGGGGVVLILMTLVQVSKIEINPWSWLAKKFGRAINGEVIEKVSKLETDFKSFRNESDERHIVTCRIRIMRFGDEILHGEKHSKEHFDQILRDITDYEIYCKDHQNFKNNIAVETINNIKTVYRKCLSDNSFI